MQIILYMTVFKAIVAWSKDFGIGRRGRLPWKNKTDLCRFARLTKGQGNNAVLMGRKTWESLPKSGLPGRHNIVLSREANQSLLANTTLSPNDVTVISHPGQCIAWCKQQKFDEAWVIGGSEIYNVFARLNVLSQIEVTIIHEEFECDTYLSRAFLDMLERDTEIVTRNEFFMAPTDFHPQGLGGEYVTYENKGLSDKVMPQYGSGFLL